MQEAVAKLEPDKLAYRLEEAVRAVGLGRTTLYELIKNGQLKTVKAAGCRLILRSDIEAFLESCREN
jgi:excisionase family DNA binding protein